MASDLTLTPHHFETKGGEFLDCELGTFSVPENRGKVGRILKLAFLRLKAKTDKPLSPVVFLSGGPGDSGIHWAKYPQFLEAFERVRDVADVILLDQRGCGQSEPNLGLRLPKEMCLGCLRSESEMLAYYEAHGKENVARLKAEGHDLPAYNVLESADDLADLRTALGAEKICLIGYSYGSHLALNTVRRHEAMLDKVVLCGWEGPDDTLKLPSNVQRQLVKLADLCNKQDVDDGLLDRMEAVHSWLENDVLDINFELPKSDEKVSLEIGRFSLQHIVSTWMGVSNRFGALPKLYREIEEGKTTELIRAVQLLVRGWARPATFYLTDGASSASPARLALIEEQAPGCLLGHAVNFPFPAINSTYEPRDLGPAFWEPVSTELPLLVVSGTLDGNTPAEQAAEQLRRCPNGMQHIIENAAHNDMLIPEGVHEAIVDFLASGKTERLSSSMPEPVFSG
jgi:pimeloyl-ACP methyl ester carboxylesterase